jgi:predicted ATPase/class 3 adenylate cyclase
LLDQANDLEKRKAMAGFPSGTVTFLFTDIEGSTRLAQRYHDSWEVLRNRHHSILRNAIESNNGYVFQIIGDAFCAAFHTAGEAVRAAAKSQTDLHAEDWGAAPIKVRMGIHTGKAEIQENGEYHGYLAMSRIQRLMSVGHGGQVLISAGAQELLAEDLPEGISLRDLGQRRLKDLVRPERIYQLVSVNLPVDFPPIITLEAYRHNLPTQMTSFIGREKEIQEIKQAMLTHRLLTLTGSGGTGKTRLSLQVAAELLDDFPDGTWFVELAGLADPDFIPQTILSAVGIPEQPGMTVMQLLVDYLREKKLLLILDNCEHLLEASAKLVNTLLIGSSTLNIVATSREALGIAGEMIWHVPSLSLPDIKQLPTMEQLSEYEAVQLFIERAALAQPHFQVTAENAPALAQICSRLDGIPLAIELAAARVRALSMEQIARRLDDRFRLLTGGSRTALERHQTLRATIDWSYNLLSADERLLLRRLSVFAGSWTLEAAEQVCVEGAGDLDVLDLLTHLIEKSLVLMDGSRYHMLETTRQYAREKLLDSEEGEALHNQHFAYFLDLAERGDQEVRGPSQVEWLQRLNAMRENWRAALEWAIETQQTGAALQMARKLDRSWFVRGDHTEAQYWLGRVLALPDSPGYPEAYSEALTQLANHKWLIIGPREARPPAEQALAIARAHDDKWNTAKALAVLGLVLTNENDFAAAQSTLEESSALFREVQDQWGYAHTLICLALGYYVQDDRAAALALHQEALVLFRELGDRYFESVALRFIGNLLVKHDNLAGGLAAFREALMLAQQLDSKWEIFALMLSFAEAAQGSRNPAQAVRLYVAAKKMADAMGAWRPEDDAELQNSLASCRAALGESGFVTAAEQGRSMTMEQAIDCALEFQGG